MQIDDLLAEHNKESGELWVLRSKCSQFIHESEGHPLLKNLNTSCEDIHRVKVRAQKGKVDEFESLFNQTFADESYAIRNRSIFANGMESFEPSGHEDMEPFFVFPIDGYKFMYSKEVQNSSDDYKHVFETIVDKCGDTSLDVVTDLLKFTYTYENLVEGIQHGSEIIIYNIPYFYAVRASKVNDYDALLTSIKELE